LRASKRIFVLYCGLNEGLARYVASLLKLALPETETVYINSDYAFSTVVPYLAEQGPDLVILIGDDASLDCVDRGGSAVRLLGIRCIAFATRASEYISKMSGCVVASTGEFYHIKAMLITMKAAVMLNPSSGRLAVLERFLRSISEALLILKKYESAIEEARSARNSIEIYASTSMVQVCEEAARRGLNAHQIDYIAYVEPKSRPLIFATSSEEHSVRKYINRLMLKGYKPVTLSLNVDPFIAPIVGMLALYRILDACTL